MFFPFSRIINDPKRGGKLIRMGTFWGRNKQKENSLFLSPPSWKKFSHILFSHHNVELSLFFPFLQFFSKMNKLWFFYLFFSKPQKMGQNRESEKARPFWPVFFGLTRPPKFSYSSPEPDNPWDKKMNKVHLIDFQCFLG